MMSRDLIRQELSPAGIAYIATEAANPFLGALSSDYIVNLKERAAWVAERFGHVTDEEARETIQRFFDKWTTEFQPIELTPGGGR